MKWDFPGHRAEAVLRRATAITQAIESRSGIGGSASSAAILALRAEPAAPSRSHQDIMADAHAATTAARQIPAHPLRVMDSRTAAIRQTYTDNVTATASLRRRQLRLRASQMRALRCLLAAEPQLAGYSAMVCYLARTPVVACSAPQLHLLHLHWIWQQSGMLWDCRLPCILSSHLPLQDSMVQQAVSLLNTALMHVELAERVLSGWEATEALPLIITRADDRAEAAAAVARDLLHSLHTGMPCKACRPSTHWQEALLHLLITLAALFCIAPCVCPRGPYKVSGAPGCVRRQTAGWQPQATPAVAAQGAWCNIFADRAAGVPHA
jgi:hypothetical protein